METGSLTMTIPLWIYLLGFVVGLKCVVDIGKTILYLFIDLKWKW